MVPQTAVDSSMVSAGREEPPMPHLVMTHSSWGATNLFALSLSAACPINSRNSSETALAP